MGELFKEHPFGIAGGLVAAAIAAWLGWSWWAIVLSLIGGLFVGSIVDESGKKSGG